jgi:ribonucleoside-diphosphate reductase alpha chain
VWVDAKDLWMKIIRNAWLRAEPGLLFWDKVTGHNMVDCYKDFGFETVSTNPCVTGDTVIVTDRGPMIIIDAISTVINGEQLSVLSYDTENGVAEFQPIEAGALTRKNADVIKLELENGEEIKLTPDHKVYTENRGWVKAADLTEEDILISI